MDTLGELLAVPVVFSWLIALKAVEAVPLAFQKMTYRGNLSPSILPKFPVPYRGKWHKRTETVAELWGPGWPLMALVSLVVLAATWMVIGIFVAAVLGYFKVPFAAVMWTFAGVGAVAAFFYIILWIFAGIGAYKAHRWVKWYNKNQQERLSDWLEDKGFKLSEESIAAAHEKILKGKARIRLFGENKGLVLFYEIKPGGEHYVIEDSWDFTKQPEPKVNA